MLNPLGHKEIEGLIRQFLDEDVGSGDVTTNSIVPAKQIARGEFLVKQKCVVAGLGLARDVLRRLDAAIHWHAAVQDGDEVPPGRIVAVVQGRARALLTGERVALNILQRLSGVATLTRTFVGAVTGTSAQIVDTRKTTPGWRRLEKYAVRCGGGTNHRFGLYDAILIKDNHIAIAGGVTEAVKRARRAERIRPSRPGAKRRRPSGPLPLEVEVSDLKQLREALGVGAARILMDNMTPSEVRRCVRIVRETSRRDKILLECSGRISLKTVKAFARTGVDWISVGALTHSAPAVDISFEMSLR